MKPGLNRWFDSSKSECAQFGIWIYSYTYGLIYLALAWCYKANQYAKCFYNRLQHLLETILQEFDMIGLFGTQSACRSSSAFTNTTTSPATAFKSKSKATNMLLDNQINDKLKEVNNNLIKKRPHFLKFFHDNFFKSGSGAFSNNVNMSPASSCKRWELLFSCMHKMNELKQRQHM